MTVRRRLAAGLACLVAVVVAGSGAIYWSGAHDVSEQKPPALADHGPGVIRVPPPLDAPVPTMPLALSDGETVLLSAIPFAADGMRQADIGVRRGPRGTEEHQTVQEGRSRTVAGVRVEVLHVWIMSNRDNSAVDLRVSPIQ